MISLIFKIIALFFFTLFITFVFQMIATVFKIRRRVNEQQGKKHQKNAQSYANQGSTSKQDIDAEYRVVDRDKK